MKTPSELDALAQVVINEELAHHNNLLKKAWESYELYTNCDEIEASYVYYNVSIGFLLRIKNGGDKRSSEEMQSYEELKSLLLKDTRVKLIYNQLLPVKFINEHEFKSLRNALLIEFEISIQHQPIYKNGLCIRIDPLKYQDYDYSEFHLFDNIVILSQSPLLNPFIIFLKAFITIPIYLLQPDLSNLYFTKGLENLGNTCYMNVALQSLFSTIPFLQLLLTSFSLGNDKKRNLSRTLTNVAHEFLKNGNTKVAPVLLKKFISSANKDFDNDQEQDSIELIDWILDVLDLDMFKGELTTHLKCEMCRTTTENSQIFNTLSLPISKSLDKSLKHFQDWELLDSKVTCDHCHKPQFFHESIKISKYPKILVVCFKRFTSNLQKIDKFVQFSFNMTISNQNYTLFSVINHHGVFQEGHYTNYSWKGSKKKWCFFSDEIVEINVHKERVINKDAYILFYVKV